MSVLRVREGKRGNAQAAMQTFEATRPAVAAQAIGVAQQRMSILSNMPKNVTRLVGQ